MTDVTHILATGGDAPGVRETARASVMGGAQHFMQRTVGLVISPDPLSVRVWPEREQSQIVRTDGGGDGMPDVSGAKLVIPEGMTSEVTITEREARALYHALAEHFGHSVHDVRALRRDLDAERGRTDKAIGALIDIATRPVAPPVVNVSTPT